VLKGIIVSLNKYFYLLSMNILVKSVVMHVTLKLVVTKDERTVRIIPIHQKLCSLAHHQIGTPCRQESTAYKYKTPSKPECESSARTLSQYITTITSILIRRTKEYYSANQM
jgi:hypothetical protein